MQESLQDIKNRNKPWLGAGTRTIGTTPVTISFGGQITGWVRLTNLNKANVSLLYKLDPNCAGFDEMISYGSEMFDIKTTSIVVKSDSLASGHKISVNAAIS